MCIFKVFRSSTNDDRCAINSQRGMCNQWSYENWNFRAQRTSTWYTSESFMIWVKYISIYLLTHTYTFIYFKVQ